MFAASFAACSDDEGNYQPAERIQIQTPPEAIPASGGTSSVSIDRAVAQAYCADQWLNISASGSEVEVTAGANLSRESRNAKLVIKTSPADSVIVAISQFGLVFNAEKAQNISMGNKAATRIIPMVANVAVDLKSVPDWITATQTEEGIVCNISENTSGKLRTGNVIFGTGNYIQSVTVTQFDIRENLFGLYYLVGFDENGEPADVAPCVLSENGLDFMPSGLSGSIAGSFDESTLALNIGNGDYVGQYGNYHLFSMLVSSDGYINYANTPKGKFTFDYDSEYGDFVATLSGDWGGGRVTNMLIFRAFSADQFGQENSLGTLMRFSVLLRAENEEEAQEVTKAVASKMVIGTSKDIRMVK